jgi:hypothetical protein
MMSVEIYFNDLSESKQQEIKDSGLWHENINLIPLVVMEVEA